MDIKKGWAEISLTQEYHCHVKSRSLAARDNDKRLAITSGSSTGDATWGASVMVLHELPVIISIVVIQELEAGGARSRDHDDNIFSYIYRRNVSQGLLFFDSDEQM